MLGRFVKSAAVWGWFAASALGQSWSEGTCVTGLDETAELDYLLFTPGPDAGDPPPLILFLHGAGERGDDLDQVKVHGPPKLATEDDGFPFAVLAPQCPKGQWWNIDAVSKLLDDVLEQHAFDTRRIYLTGLSMGGFGSFALAAKSPNRFAAVVPICGGGEPEAMAEALVDVPLWIFHGAQDRVVPAARSTEMIEAIRAAGGDPRYLEYPNAGHDSWTETYRSPALYHWLLSHQRTSPLPSGTPEDVGFSSEGLADVSEAAQGLVDAGRLAGANLLVARHGTVVLEESFGSRDLDEDEAMTLDTIFRIYSMSKPITSTATMMLVDAALVELDDPVSLYLPEFEGLEVYVSGSGDDLVTEPCEEEVTVRDLLRHTSGLTYGFFGNTPVDVMYRERGIGNPTQDLETFTESLAEVPLLFQPGTTFMYGYSTDVLGRVVEAVSGETFDAFLRARIFEPLGMKDTGFHVPLEKQDRFSDCYAPTANGSLQVQDDADNSRFGQPAVMQSGGGGLVSTLRDYARFCQMLLNGGTLDGARILEEETVSLMMEDHLSPETARAGGLGDPRQSFGLGFAVYVNDRGGARLGESGWGGMASTHFWISPKDDLFVVALSQLIPFNGQLEATVKPLIYDALMSADE